MRISLWREGVVTVVLADGGLGLTELQRISRRRTALFFGESIAFKEPAFLSGVDGVPLDVWK